jgi:hypothetical protein
LFCECEEDVDELGGGNDCVSEELLQLGGYCVAGLVADVF